MRVQGRISYHVTSGGTESTISWRIQIWNVLLAGVLLGEASLLIHGNSVILELGMAAFLSCLFKLVLLLVIQILLSYGSILVDNFGTASRPTRRVQWLVKNTLVKQLSLGSLINWILDILKIYHCILREFWLLLVNDPKVAKVAVLVIGFLLLGHCDSLGLTQNNLSILSAIDRLQRVMFNHDITCILWVGTSGAETPSLWDAFPILGRASFGILFHNELHSCVSFNVVCVIGVALIIHIFYNTHRLLFLGSIMNILLNGLTIRGLLSLVKVAIQTIFLILWGSLGIYQALRIPCVELMLL